MKPSLQVLLDLRRRREQTARRRVQDCLAALAEQQQRVQASRARWQAYRAWRPGQEAALFAALRGQATSSRALADYTATLQQLKDEEGALARACAAAEQQAHRAESSVQQARRALNSALRSKEKLALLVERAAAEQVREGRRQEEAALDDMLAIRYTLARPRS